MLHELGLPEFRLVSGVLDKFEEAWADGAGIPCIDEYCTDIAPDVMPTLLYELAYRDYVEAAARGITTQFAKAAVTPLLKKAMAAGRSDAATQVEFNSIWNDLVIDVS